MCGIVAAASGSNIVNVLIEGLKKLEYRGYDSAGLAVIGSQSIERVRSVGDTAELTATQLRIAEAANTLADIDSILILACGTSSHAGPEIGVASNKADALFLGRGRHYPIALEGARKLNQIEASDGIHVMKLPEHYGQLSPILHVVPLQLLSYHAALVKGTDVDKPRNLAKSVTVE